MRLIGFWTAGALSLAFCLLIEPQNSSSAQMSAPGCPTRWICPADPILSPKTRIGAWYAAFYQAPGRPFAVHWSYTRYMPIDGYYASGDPAAVRSQFAQMRAVGIEYAVLDDTNGIENDEGQIEKNVRSIFDTNESLPENKRLRLAFALGIWNPKVWHVNGAAALLPHVQEEADHVYDAYASRPSYFTWKGRPLLVEYGPYNSGDVPDALRRWSDPRFTIRHSTYRAEVANPLLQQYADEGLWGWFLPEPQLASPETIAVSPGYNRKHIIPTASTIERDDGQHYMRHWLFAIKHRPENIVVASWNDFSEETQVAPSKNVRATPYVDSYGEETTDWYAQITSAYAHLRTGLMPGVYYGEENSAAFFKVVDGKLVRQSSMPHGHPVIRLPAGALEGLPGNS